MTDIAVRDLRNHTADVLRRAQSGEQITITVHGRPVADLVARREATRHPFTRAEIIEFLRTSQADPGLRDDLARLSGETTDDLGPIR